MVRCAHDHHRRIHDPIHRVSMSFERDGETLWVTTWLEHGGHLPEHFHPTLDERWEVLDGAARVKLDGRWRDADGRGRARARRAAASATSCATRAAPGPPARGGHAAGPARGVPDRERPRGARGPLRREQPADEPARRGVGERLRAALPRRDRDVLAAARAAAGAAAASPRGSRGGSALDAGAPALCGAAGAGGCAGFAATAGLVRGGGTWPAAQYMRSAVREWSAARRLWPSRAPLPPPYTPAVRATRISRRRWSSRP